MSEIKLNDDHKFQLNDHNYGKSGVKILHLVRNGLVHIVKELEVSTRLTLATEKDYLRGDNSDIIATDSQKNIVYLLAKKYGVKSPEDFAILLCNHFMSKYDHVMKTSIRVEEVMWNRVNYGDQANVKLHNHAFVHTPICTRSASAVLKRGDQYPSVESGIKNLRVLKTTKSSFVNFINDEYRTLPDQDDRIFSTIVDCSWAYRKNPEVDYDKSWKLVKQCILRNFAGDLDQGVPSPSVQNTLYVTEKDILDKIRDIVSIEMTLPNKHYVSVDFSQFKSIVNNDQEQNVYLPLDKPSGTIYAKLDRKNNKL